MTETASQQPTGLRRLWCSGLCRLLALLLLGKGVVLITAFIADRTPDFLHLMSTRWDAEFFQSIANFGYTQNYLYAFSPVYPVLVRGLGFITGNSWVAAFVLTNVLSFLFPVILYRTFGYRTALLATLFPVYLVYTTVPYSDVVMLVLLALSVMFALRQQLTAASAFITLGVVSSYRLIVLLPAYLLATIKGKRFSWLLFYVLPAIGGGLLLLWFWVNTGDCFIYFPAEGYWGVHPATPWDQVKWLLNTDGQGWFTGGEWTLFGAALPPYFWLIRNIAFVVFYLVGALYLLKTDNPYRHFLLALSLLAIVPLLFVVGTSVVSIPRLLLPAFPIFLGYTVAWRPRYDWLYGAVCLPLTAVITVMHTGSFFA